MIGLALVGSGIFAKEQHLPAVQATPYLKLVAVYSRTLKSAQELGGSITSATLYSDDAGEGRSFDALLARQDIEALLIALPITAQPAYIKRALEAGKHVFSEKPIAPTVKEAKELLAWHREHGKSTWCVAENNRYLDSFNYGADQVQKLGRVLHFRTKVSSMMRPDNKYMGTQWRRQPEHQGGFILDGGIHHVASLRMLLGEGNDIARVSAFTAQLQEHLPPLDTVNAALRTKTGITGVFAASSGTTELDNEWFVACEKGTVKVRRWPHEVFTVIEGKEGRREFPSEDLGVIPEVKVWAGGLKSGKMDKRQSAEEALKDLEVLEAMFRSGERDGQPVDVGQEEEPSAARSTG